MGLSDAIASIHALRDRLMQCSQPNEDAANDRNDADAGRRRLVALVSAATAWPPSQLPDLIRTACRLTHVLGALGMRPPEASSAAEARALQAARGVLQRSLELLHYLEQTLCTLTQSSRVLTTLPSDAPAAPLSSSLSNDASNGNPNARAAAEEDDALVPGVARFAGVDSTAKITPLQQLILYMLNVVFARGYRRCGADCYERRPAPGGFDSHAWRRVCSIKELIYDSTRKELKFDQWMNLTRCNVQNVVDYMTSFSDAQFPVLRKDRHTFAFRNGVYRAFVPASSDTHDEDTPMADAPTASAPAPSAAHEGAFRDAWLPYGSAEHAALPHDLAACNYFDADFPGACHERCGRTAPGDWYTTVATPSLQMVLDYQGFPEEVCRWMYVMIGRLLYELNELDRWQVLPYLKGQASSGKSTIVDTCREIFECCDVGVLSNNMERKFGIGALRSKVLFVAPEIKADLQLEQAEFQSMVSGEPLQLAIKYQESQTVEWKVPGIMAGNEVPGWVDNSGSIGRRLVLFEFMRKVANGDMHLRHKLRREMPALLLKANRAYHEAVRACAADNVWTHLPEYFKRTKADLTEETNPIQHFMASGKLRFERDAYMPMDVLKRAFQAHCDENNFKRIRLTRDKFEPVMFDHGLLLEKSAAGTTRPYPAAQSARPPTEEDGTAAATATTAGTAAGPRVCHKEWCLGADLDARHHTPAGGNLLDGAMQLA